MVTGDAAVVVMVMLVVVAAVVVVAATTGDGDGDGARGGSRKDRLLASRVRSDLARDWLSVQNVGYCGRCRADVVTLSVFLRRTPESWKNHVAARETWLRSRSEFPAIMAAAAVSSVSICY